MVVLLLVLGLAIRGYFRGLLAQLVGLVGVLLGIVIGSMVQRWVGAHWAGARPTAIFWMLRWMVTLLVALAVIAFFGVAGERAGKAVRESPVGWLDRLAGMVTGAIVGLACASLIVLGAVRLPLPRWIHHAASASRWSRPLLQGGVTACRLGHVVPGGTALGRQYLEARVRLERRASST